LQVGEAEALEHGLVGKRPVRVASRLRCCASAFCSGGKVASTWASAACWAATSAPVTAPRPDWRFRMSSVSRWVAMMRCVASIWARSEASRIAAATTLAASDR
jgi:hypothetical protein